MNGPIFIPVIKWTLPVTTRDTQSSEEVQNHLESLLNYTSSSLLALKDPQAKASDSVRGFVSDYLHYHNLIYPYTKQDDRAILQDIDKGVSDGGFGRKIVRQCQDLERQVFRIWNYCMFEVKSKDTVLLRKVVIPGIFYFWNHMKDQKQFLQMATDLLSSSQTITGI